MRLASLRTKKLSVKMSVAASRKWTRGVHQQDARSDTANTGLYVSHLKANSPRPSFMAPLAPRKHVLLHAHYTRADRQSRQAAEDKCPASSPKK